MARSEAARQRRRARLAGYVASVGDRQENSVRALMRPDGLAPGAASAFARPDRSIDETAASAALPANRRGSPTLPDTRDRLRDSMRNDARPTWAQNERAPRRKPKCDESAACICPACCNDRRVARHLADRARAARTGRGWV